MSWRDQFRRLKDEVKQFNADHNILPGSQSSQPSYSQQNYYPGQQPLNYANIPPPPQFGTHPQAPPQQPVNSIYWQPRFQPGIPIAQEWAPEIGNSNGWGNNELEYYTANPENAFYTNDTKLIIRAIANNSSRDKEQKYTSARLVSRQLLSRDRGMLSATITSPCAPGIWPAFWLLPKEPFEWPVDGEVDIAETWNGDCNNHSCLHWGQYTPKDASKHRMLETRIGDMPHRPVTYEWAWDQPNGQAGQGRMIWWIDGRPVMKAFIPAGTKPMREWNILLNVAMGGDVCAGKLPKDGAYDMVVHNMFLAADPNGGWGRFEADWTRTPDGNTM